MIVSKGVQRSLTLWESKLYSPNGYPFGGWNRIIPMTIQTCMGPLVYSSRKEALPANGRAALNWNRIIIRKLGSMGVGGRRIWGPNRYCCFALLPEKRHHSNSDNHPNGEAPAYWWLAVVIGLCREAMA
jgi:hypothetical protein